MGKGDKKSKRGKIALGSYGVSRPRRTAKKITVAKVVVEKTVEEAPKKATKAKKSE